jgi:hypothetical protein
MHGISAPTSVEALTARSGIIKPVSPDRREVRKECDGIAALIVGCRSAHERSEEVVYASQDVII